MAKKSGPPLLMIGIVLVVLVAGFFLYKKMKAKSSLPSMPSMDAIVKNQTQATQQAHAARLGCSSCGG